MQMKCVDYSSSCESASLAAASASLAAAFSFSAFFFSSDSNTILSLISLNSSNQKRSTTKHKNMVSERWKRVPKSNDRMTFFDVRFLQLGVVIDSLFLGSSFCLVFLDLLFRLFRDFL
jgi:hypothetical protein